MVLPAWGVALVVVNFLFWGHWPICAKMAGAPPQPFGVVMVLTQTGCAFLACFASGDRFFDALAADSHASPTAVFCVLLGGAALAIGDFSAAAAVERLGLAVGGPVCFSCMLICGAIGDFLLEGSAHPLLLFGGVAGCMCAVVADSQSHPPKRRSSLASADGAQAVAAATEEERLESEVERAIRVIKQAEGVATASPVPPTRLALAEDEGGEEKQGVAGAGAPGAGTHGASEALRALPTAPMSAMELEEGGRLPASSTGSSGQQAGEASAHVIAPSDADRSEFWKGMAVAVVGGCIGGMCAEPHASAHALLHCAWPAAHALGCRVSAQVDSALHPRLVRAPPRPLGPPLLLPRGRGGLHRPRRAAPLSATLSIDVQPTPPQPGLRIGEGLPLLPDRPQESLKEEEEDDDEEEA